jgi:hypothetical protein
VVIDNIFVGLLPDNPYTLWITRPRYFILDCIAAIAGDGFEEPEKTNVIYGFMSFLSPHTDWKPSIGALRLTKQVVQ